MSSSASSAKTSCTIVVVETSGSSALIHSRETPIPTPMASTRRPIAMSSP